MRTLKDFLLLSYGATGKQKMFIIISLEALKKRMGFIIARAFMSDDFQSFYNAWVNVFCKTTHHLMCEWHVTLKELGGEI